MLESSCETATATKFICDILWCEILEVGRQFLCFKDEDCFSGGCLSLTLWIYIQQEFLEINWYCLEINGVVFAMSYHTWVDLWYIYSTQGIILRCLGI